MRTTPHRVLDGSERGPVALPVFKIGRLPLTAGGLGSTPRRFRHSTRKRELTLAGKLARGKPLG